MSFNIVNDAKAFYNDIPGLIDHGISKTFRTLGEVYIELKDYPRQQKVAILQSNQFASGVRLFTEVTKVALFNIVAIKLIAAPIFLALGMVSFRPTLFVSLAFTALLYDALDKSIAQTTSSNEIKGAFAGLWSGLTQRGGSLNAVSKKYYFFRDIKFIAA